MNDFDRTGNIKTAFQDLTGRKPISYYEKEADICFYDPIECCYNLCAKDGYFNNTNKKVNKSDALMLCDYIVGDVFKTFKAYDKDGVRVSVACIIYPSFKTIFENSFLGKIDLFIKAISRADKLEDRNSMASSFFNKFFSIANAEFGIDFLPAYLKYYGKNKDEYHTELVKIFATKNNKEFAGRLKKLLITFVDNVNNMISVNKALTARKTFPECVQKYWDEINRVADENGDVLVADLIDFINNQKDVDLKDFNYKNCHGYGLYDESNGKNTHEYLNLMKNAFNATSEPEYYDDRIDFFDE